LHILSVGKLLYSSDNRYEVVHRSNMDEYQLRIDYVQPKDQDVYECQISTKPVTAFHIHLRVLQDLDQGTHRNPYLVQRHREQKKKELIHPADVIGIYILYT
jgi:hypothetical protein